MHTYSIGIWIWCCLFCVLSYTSLLPQKYRFSWQLTIHINTRYLLICYPHRPLIHYQFRFILTFVFLLMIWPQFSFFLPYWLLSRVFASYYLFDLLVPLHQIPAEQPHLFEHFYDSFLHDHTSRDIRNIIWDVASCFSRL